MNEKLLLQDLVVLLAKKSGITQKEADRFFRELFQLILESIYENDIVKIKDFGTFKLVKVNSRESVNVNTGEKIEIPAHYKLSFAPDKSLKELVNEPFAHFESVVLDDSETEEVEEQQTPEDNKKDTTAVVNTDSTESIEDIVVFEEEKLPEEDEMENDLTDSESDTEEETIPEEKEHNEKPVPEKKSDSLLSEISFVKENPVFVEKNEKEESDPEEKGTEAEDIPQEKKQEEKPKRKIELIDLVDLKSLPRRTIKIEEKKPKTDAPPLLDLIDVKKEKKVIETKISEEPPRSIDEKEPVQKKEVLERKIIIEKKPETIIQETTTIAPEIKKQVPVSNENLKRETAIVDNFNNTEPDDIDSGVDYIPPHFNDEETTDVDYHYIDYEKLAEESKWKRRIPIIAVVVIVLGFAIYQFAKLFDVTYDYEYYINHVPPLTLSDSLPIIDEQEQSPVTGVKADTIALARPVSKVTAKPVEKPAKTSGASVNPITNEPLESNLDDLIDQLKSSGTVEPEGIDISENLHIKVTNKAEVFLSENQ